MRVCDRFSEDCGSCPIFYPHIVSAYKADMIEAHAGANQSLATVEFMKQVRERGIDLGIDMDSETVRQLLMRDDVNLTDEQRASFEANEPALLAIIDQVDAFFDAQQDDSTDHAVSEHPGRVDCEGPITIRINKFGGKTLRLCQAQLTPGDSECATQYRALNIETVGLAIQRQQDIENPLGLNNL